MNKIACAVICFALAAPATVTAALAQSIGERTGISAIVGAAPSTTDFVAQTALGDLFGIEAGKLALERGGDKAKRFAAKIIKDHEETSEALKALIKGGGLRAPVPTEIDSSRRAILDKLKMLQGPSFDKEYSDTQASEQAGALSLFERYSSGGDHPDLKLFASKRLRSLEERVRMAQELKG